jgi:hypothetical protein
MLNCYVDYRKMTNGFVFWRMRCGRGANTPTERRGYTKEPMVIAGVLLSWKGLILDGYVISRTWS